MTQIKTVILHDVNECMPSTTQEYHSDAFWYVERSEWVIGIDADGDAHECYFIRSFFTDTYQIESMWTDDHSDSFDIRYWMNAHFNTEEE